MITLETSNDELIETIKHEQNKVSYWLARKTGAKRERELAIELSRKCKLTRIPQTSDLVKFESQSGNIWYAYYRAYSVGDTVVVGTYSFMYKNSSGSITVYMPMNGPGGKLDRRVIIFPPHFFARMGQRLEIKIEGEDMIKRFLAMMNSMYVRFKGDSDKRKDEVEIVFSGAVWRGVCVNGDYRVIKASTFIKKTALSKKQRMIADESENIQKKTVKHKDYTTRLRIERGEGAQILKELAYNCFACHIRDNSFEIHFARCCMLVKLVGDYMGMKFTLDDMLEVWINDCATQECEIIDAFYRMGFVHFDISSIGFLEMYVTIWTLKELGCNLSDFELAYYFNNAMPKKEMCVDVDNDEFYRVTRKDFMV